MPEFAGIDVAPTADGANDHSLSEEGDRSKPGHIGLIVLSSIAVGLGLGLVLDLLVFGGGREPVITGAALLSLAVGFAMLAELSIRRTNQPQEWARIPAICFGAAGAAILILRPSTHVLGLLGWVWPILLMALIVWMFRRSRRSLHSWSRRALLYPAFVLLALVALGGAFETVVEAATSNKPPPGGRTYVVAGHSLYLRCVGSGSPAGLGCRGMSRARPGSVSSIAPAKVGAEKALVDRTHISFPPMCEAFLRLPRFRAHTSSRVTRLEASTHSPTRWTIRGTWPGSR
jgi:hypothetical protein